MKIKEERNRITIEPTTPVEEAYMEEVLNLRKADDTCTARRVNAMGLGCMAYLEISKDKNREKVEARPWQPRTLEEHLSGSSEVPKIAGSVAKFAKRMYKYASTMQEMFPTVNDLKMRLTEARREKAWGEVAIIAMLLEEVHHYVEEAKTNKL